MAKINKHSRARFSDISQCESNNLENHTVVADMDGSLLIGRNFFPYFAVAAFELGGVLRLLFLVLASPLAGLLYHLVSESAGIRMLVFATFVGTRMSEIESVARAVLPKFYSGDIHPEAWRVFSSCRRKCVITENPRIMVEPFVKEYLGADLVIGSEISAIGGRATGLVFSPRDLKKVLATRQPEIGIANWKTKFPFLELCKESYLVSRNHEAVSPVSPDKLLKRVMFHDGRLVQKPCPLVALAIILWFPIGLILAVIRIAACTLLPMPAVYYAFWALGVKVTVKGTVPPRAQKSLSQRGVLFVCSHRTLLDPVFLSIALGRPIPTVTYSLSRLSEIISPIKTVRLHRDRIKDANIIKKLLQRGDLVIFPEGTTSREPILLRFSALFAELSDELVPVVMVNRMSMFHATTARGWKGMDTFYFFMNPSPGYEVTFLNKLPYDVTCGAGKSSHDVANYIQRAIAATLSYECTNLTRKDKYRALVGNDGNVGG